MADAREQRAGPTAPVAPWWHTLLLIALLAGTSVAGYVSTRRSHGADTHHALNYTLTIIWEWVLAAFVFWGLRLRRTSLRQILGVQRDGAHAWLKDAGIALGFWFASLLVLGTLALLLRPLHLDPADIRSVVSKLAPGTPRELLLWLGMSITAGLCEEFIFRGYLQQQFTFWTRFAWTGLLSSAVLFGLAHSYEGMAGMLLIAAYGALFGVLTQIRHSLRAGMMAHSWHDALSGFALFFAHHYAGRLPH